MSNKAKTKVAMQKFCFSAAMMIVATASAAKWKYELPVTPIPRTLGVSSAQGAMHIFGQNGSVATTRNGKEWAYSALPFSVGPDLEVESIQEKLFVQSGGHVFLSLDSAKTWTTIYHSETSLAVSIESKNDTLFLITTTKSILRHDSGNKWTAVGSGQPGKLFRTDSLWLLYTDSRTIYSSVDGQSWLTTDGPPGTNDIKLIHNSIGVCTADRFIYYKNGIIESWSKKAPYCSFADSSRNIYIVTQDSTFIVDTTGLMITASKRDIQIWPGMLSWYAGNLFSVEKYGDDPYNSISIMKDGKWSRFDSTLRGYNSICSSPIGTFVAVGSMGRITTRVSNGEFIHANSPTTRSLNKVIWSKNQFVAVGDSSTLITSNDGLFWTTTNQHTNTSYRSISSNNDSVYYLISNTSLMESQNLQDWQIVYTSNTDQFWQLAQHDTLIAIGGINNLHVSSLRNLNNWALVPGFEWGVNSVENVDSGFLVSSKSGIFMVYSMNAKRKLSYGTVYGDNMNAAKVNDNIHAFVDSRALHWDNKWKLSWDEIKPVDAEITGIAANGSEVFACGRNGQIIQYIADTPVRSHKRQAINQELRIFCVSENVYVIGGKNIKASDIKLYDLTGKLVQFNYSESMNGVKIAPRSKTQLKSVVLAIRGESSRTFMLSR